MDNNIVLTVDVMKQEQLCRQLTDQSEAGFQIQKHLLMSRIEISPRHQREETEVTPKCFEHTEVNKKEMYIGVRMCMLLTYNSQPYRL